MFRGILDFLELIKFEHTLFALPFAYIGMLLAAGAWPSWRQIAWITVAMAAARTLAMGVNRLADRVLDAQNPRTAERPLVSGRVPTRTAWIGTAIATVVLVLAAGQLGTLPLKLLPVAVVFLVGYSFSKRFTWLSHYILGFTDGLAPVGAWIAVRGSLFSDSDLPAWLLLAAVTFWIGGFDLIYACQDVEVDRAAGLQAIPARFGIEVALWLSALSHLVAAAALITLGYTSGLGWPYAIGIVAVIGLLAVEHLIVSSDDFSHINIAFFHVNSAISVVLFTSVLAAVWMKA